MTRTKEWKSDNVSNETGNNTLIISEELDRLRTGTAEIKITFRRPIQRQNNGSRIRVNLKKLLQHKHNTDFNNPKTRD
jgi:hypothetical protein